jgi:hypothetical protein
MTSLQEARQTQLAGWISVQLDVWCGWCGIWRTLESTKRAAAEREARKLGYRKSLTLGWLCPDCARFVLKAQVSAREDNGQGDVDKAVQVC